MKRITSLLTALCLVSCGNESPQIQSNPGTKVTSSAKQQTTCLAAEDVKVIKFNSEIYYATLYGGGQKTFDNLRIIVSNFDFSERLEIDYTFDYSSEEDKDNLISCLGKDNSDIFAQDIWLGMQKSLNAQDDARWVTGKSGNSYPEQGFYPQTMAIENPDIATFKLDERGAEIKSSVFSNHSDTEVTTIYWKLLDGKYVFDKYETKVLDDVDSTLATSVYADKQDDYIKLNSGLFKSEACKTHFIISANFFELNSNNNKDLSNSLDYVNEYVNFKNIPRYSYESEELEIISEGLQAVVVSETEFTIQNYGNAMNPFIYFPDCGKFLHYKSH